MYGTLGSHGMQQARLPYPSSTPGVSSNSSPLSQQSCSTISPSITSFSFCFQSFSASGSCQWVGSAHKETKVLRLQPQCQSFLWIFRIDFLMVDLFQLLASKRLLRAFSHTTIWAINSSALSLLYRPIITSVCDYYKNHSFDHFDVCVQSDILLLNTLSGLVIAFLPRSNCLWISGLKSPSAVILEPSVTVSVFASIWIKWWD